MNGIIKDAYQYDLKYQYDFGYSYLPCVLRLLLVKVSSALKLIDAHDNFFFELRMPENFCFIKTCP